LQVEPNSDRAARTNGKARLLAGASVLAVGYLMPMIYFIWSLRYGQVASANPWGATGLEWKTLAEIEPDDQVAIQYGLRISRFDARA